MTNYQALLGDERIAFHMDDNYKNMLAPTGEKYHSKIIKAWPLGHKSKIESFYPLVKLDDATKILIVKELIKTFIKQKKEQKHMIKYFLSAGYTDDEVNDFELEEINSNPIDPVEVTLNRKLFVDSDPKSELLAYIFKFGSGPQFYDPDNGAPLYNKRNTQPELLKVANALIKRKIKSEKPSTDVSTGLTLTNNDSIELKPFTNATVKNELLAFLFQNGISEFNKDSLKEDLLKAANDFITAKNFDRPK